MSTTAKAQTTGLDSDTRTEIANIAEARYEELSGAKDELRRDTLAAGRKPTLREYNAIRFDQPKLDRLLDLGFQVISETPPDWEVIYDLLAGICYSHPDDRIVEFCIGVLQLPVDLEPVADANPNLFNGHQSVPLALGILAQQGTPDAMAVLRESVMLGETVSSGGTSAMLPPVEGKALSPGVADQYSGVTVTAVLDIVDSNMVVPFFQDIANSVDPNSKLGRALENYLEIARRVEQGHPNPHNIVE